MAIDFTTVVAIDEEHLRELRWVWPTWCRHRSEILAQPLLLICDAAWGEDRWRSELEFLSHPSKKVVIWTMKGVPQREKMLSSLVLATAEHVTTQWYLKLDTDTVAVSEGEWLLPPWFEPDGQGRPPVFVTSPWGFTKPADAIDRLDEWGDQTPGLREFAPLKLHGLPGAQRLAHRRIISWCFFGQTAWTRQMAQLCPKCLPVPSQDTFLWYCAARRQEHFRTVRMSQFGWNHVSRSRKLASICQQALPTVDPTSMNTPTMNVRKAGPHALEIVRLLTERGIQDMQGAEIGVARGNTSQALLAGLPGLFLFMIDPWTTYTADHPYRRSHDRGSRLSAEQQNQNRQQAQLHTEFAQHRRQLVALNSTEGARFIGESSLDFAFIDGDHTYDAVKADLHAWWPKVKPGGLLLGHDYRHPRNRNGKFGVQCAVDEWAAQVGTKVSVERGDLWWVNKPPSIVVPAFGRTHSDSNGNSQRTEQAAERGVIYLLSGISHAARLAVSLHSLRQYWNGPVTVFSTDEPCAQVVSALAADPCLNIQHHPMQPATVRRNRSYCTKPLLTTVTPYDWSLYLDADTLVVGPLEELFQQAPLVITQFSNWVSTGPRMRRRIQTWRGLNTTVDALVDAAVSQNMPAINTGVVGFQKGFDALERWRELTTWGRRKFIVDEIAMQLLYPTVSECRIVDDRWNRSPTYFQQETDTRIWHFHGDRHLRTAKGKSAWLPMFQQCWRDNLGNMQQWLREIDPRDEPTSLLSGELV